MSSLQEPPYPVTAAAPKPGTAEYRARRNAKSRGKRAEKRVAELLGGELTISSGRTALEKGDVRVKDLKLFVEVKYCGVRQGRGDTSVSFDREWLEKTVLDAEAVGLLPLVALRFRDGSGAYATTADVFERLIGQIRRLKAELAAVEDIREDLARSSLNPPDSGQPY